jgi:protein ImuA
MTARDLPFFPPAKGRTHEACGPGATVFGLVLAARLGGKTLWVREAWETEQLNPVGLLPFLDPADLLVARAKDQTESLAVAEEALRAGAVSLGIISLNKPIGLTEGRRLQLAARDGKAIGLALISDGMGSNAAETRWRCTPVFDSSTQAEDSTLQKWELIKNKSGTLGVWHVRWDRASRRLHLVSSPRE